MSSNARCVQLSEELDENIKELQSMEEAHTESKAEIKKVMLLCSWRVGKALESAVPVCVMCLSSAQQSSKWDQRAGVTVAVLPLLWRQ